MGDPIVEQVAAILARGRMANQPDKNAREVVALVRADWGERIAQQIEAERIKYPRDAEDHNYNGGIDAAARIAREVGR